VRTLKLQWNELLAATQLKGLRLKQAIDAQLFYRSLADLDLWLNESEHTVFSNDYGRDLPSTLLLKRRLADLEDEWLTKSARVRELDQDLERMLNDGHFDSDHLRENGELIRNRYYGLENPINERKARLHESLKTHEMRRDVGDEEQWIREKELSLSASRKQNTTG
jgi:spectrin alpha